jgi:hypothetical protein
MINFFFLVDDGLVGVPFYDCRCGYDDIMEREGLGKCSRGDGREARCEEVTLGDWSPIFF